MTKEKQQAKPPEISPFVFPAILAFFGIWCLYDGWLTADPEMQKHLLFNRIAGGILVPWAIIDFIRTWKKEQKYKKDSLERKNRDSPPPSAENDD